MIPLSRITSGLGPLLICEYSCADNLRVISTSSRLMFQDPVRRESDPLPSGLTLSTALSWPSGKPGRFTVDTTSLKKKVQQPSVAW
ncbi:hypothetical protein N7517_000524 [Penicillium concentricum]|uniref:Uncharacterized protein n=1 Tax=Penicillium concentricum TaxID=293559 RepID=A0A9W9VHP0_9EURO|nr:uncharacterized protein N7517_000524 [Penicillium concentricum]KAJ5382613.1 hypothetical protein N7517_000524 [Penicillium concentricum]